MAATDFETAVSQTITSSNQLSDVINLSATETVTTDSGEIPSVRKAIADSMLFIAPIPWEDGQDETNLFQTRSFEKGLYWAPSATTINPVPMGSTPIGDDNWFLAPISLTEDFVKGVIEETTGYKGDYGEGILLEDGEDYIKYNGKSYFATNPPYTTTATTPDNDTGNLFVGGYITSDFGTVQSGTTVNHRRGTNAEILAGTPAIGELWFNTTDNSIHMGDGFTQGGVKHLNTTTGVRIFNSMAELKSNTFIKNGETCGVHSELHDKYIEGNVRTASSEILIDEFFNIELDNGLVWVQDATKNKASIGSTLKRKLEANLSDCAVQIVGDSTGNENTEWVYKLFSLIGVHYPKFTVKIHYWNETTNDSYNAPVTIQSGTGVYTLNVYNASKAGGSALYFQGGRFPIIHANDVDWVIHNLGHNGGTSLSYRIIYDMHYQGVIQMINRHRYADFTVVLQNFRTDFEDFSLRAVSAISDIADTLSLSKIDVYSLFKNAQDKGFLNEWMSDTVHPNPTGSNAWANLAASCFLYGEKTTTSIRSKLTLMGESLIKDPFMLDFPWDANGPANATVFNATAEIETSISESGRSIKLTSAGSLGYLRWTLTGLQRQQITNVNNIVFAARVYIPSTSTSDSNGRIFANTENGDPTTISQNVCRDGWFWSLLSVESDFFKDSSYVRLGVYVSGGDTVYIDRIVMVDGVELKEPLKLPVVLSDYYRPENVTGQSETVVNVTGNSIEVSPSSQGGSDYRFIIDIPDTVDGATYKIEWDADTSNATVYARDGLGGVGSVLSSGSITSNELEFTAVSDSSSVQVVLSIQSLPRTMSDVKITAIAAAVK